MSEAKTVRVTQIASGNGRKPGQQATLVGLGLNKIDPFLFAFCAAGEEMERFSIQTISGKGRRALQDYAST